MADEMKHILYTILLWLSDRELTIALNTGRNPDSIKQLRADIKRWDDALRQLNLPPLYD